MSTLVIRFVARLPKNKVSDVIGYQLAKSGTSIGANYREANRDEWCRSAYRIVAQTSPLLFTMVMTLDS